MTGYANAIGLRAERWRWTRKPTSVHISSDDTMMWTCEHASDFWRLTRSGMVKHDGHAYVTEVSGDFVMEGRFEADLSEKYDQLGLVVLKSDTVWLKTGTERDGGLMVGAVNTREFSDWSRTPGSLPVTMRVERREGTIEICTVAAGRSRMIRQLYLDGIVSVGAYSAAPRGGGFVAHLAEFRLMLDDEGGFRS